MSELLMPKLGLTMTEGLVSEWRVTPGQRFVKGDILFVVETEKVATDVEAEAEGTLETILVQEGDTVEVGKPVAVFLIEGETVEPEAAQALDASPNVKDAPSARKPMAEHGLTPSNLAMAGCNGRALKEGILRIVATPLAKRIAAQEGVDLRVVRGSGPKGRIKADDVKSAIADAAAGAVPGAAKLQTLSDLIAPDAARLATARRVSQAKREIPHFYLSQNADIRALIAFRTQLNAAFAPLKLSVTHLLLKAIGQAIGDDRCINRVWLDAGIQTFETVDIGIVVDTENGVRIPVVRNVDGRPLDRLAQDAIALVARARMGQLGGDDVGGGVMAISNIGMMGAASLTPIINPPHAMILGVGAEQAVFRPAEDGLPELRREIALTLACDHRLLDGADAARFLARLVNYVEQPFMLLRTTANSLEGA